MARCARTVRAALAALVLLLLAAPAVSHASFAVVDSAGGLVRGKDAVFSQKTGIGAYEVAFDRDVSGCVFTATVSAPAYGLVVTSPSSGSPNAVHVETSTAVQPSGTALDLPFSLDVHCVGDGMWAAVNANGTIARRSDPAITAAGTGAVQMVFPQPVAACSEQAVGTAPRPGPLVSAGRGATQPNGIRIETKHLGAGLAAFPFQVWVQCAPDALWAVVQADGGLRRGAGASAVARLAPGVYEVAFGRDVTDCSYGATIADPGDAEFVFEPGLIAASRSATNPAAVRVETRRTPFFDPNVPPVDKPFHLALDCNPLPPPPPPPSPAPAASAGTAVAKRPLPRLRPDVRFRMRLGRRVQVLLLRVVDVPRGTRVAVSCLRRCSLRRATASSRRVVNLTALFRGRLLPPGVTIQIRVTKRGAIGRYFRYTVTSRRVIGTECAISPQTGTPTACSRT